MKLLTRSILCSALALIPLSQASAISPHNGDFDNTTAWEGWPTTYLPSWDKISGSIRLANPTGSEFLGEGGDGFHKNALYLVHDTEVSQNVSKALSPATPYVLEFDVGHTETLAAHNYTIKLETIGNDDPSKNGIILEVLNPLRPPKAGFFGTAKVPFTLPEPLSGHYKITISTEGLGELYFDNIEMYENGQKPIVTIPYLKTVAYGNTFYNAATDSRTCTVDYSLENSSGAYLTASEGECQCVNSQTIFMSKTEHFSGDVRTFYQCRVTTQ